MLESNHVLISCQDRERIKIFSHDLVKPRAEMSADPMAVADKSEPIVTLAISDVGVTGKAIIPGIPVVSQSTSPVIFEVPSSTSGTTMRQRLSIKKF